MSLNDFVKDLEEGELSDTNINKQEILKIIVFIIFFNFPFFFFVVTVRTRKRPRRNC